MVANSPLLPSLWSQNDPINMSLRGGTKQQTLTIGDHGFCSFFLFPEVIFGLPIPWTPPDLRLLPQRTTKSLSFSCEALSWHLRLSPLPTFRFSLSSSSVETSWRIHKPDPTKPQELEAKQIKTLWWFDCRLALTCFETSLKESNWAVKSISFHLHLPPPTLIASISSCLSDGTVAAWE